MLLDELIEVIDTLQQRIADHGQVLRVSETRTRMALIDPLLQVLGWDTSDPSLVVPEYSSAGGGKADYALFGQEGGLAAIIEAKKLGEQLQPHLRQMFSYAAMEGVKYAGITDGDQWELYDVMRPGALTERQELNLRISAASSHQSALNLLLLWRPNLSSGQAQPASKPLVVEPRAVEPSNSEPPPQSPGEWVPLSEFAKIREKSDPKSIRFPDGSEYSVQYLYHLVLGAIAWLWSRKILRTGDLSRFSTPHRHLVHTEAVHPSGKKFHSPKKVEGTPLYVEANLTGLQCVEKTNELLSHFGQDTVHVQVERKRK